MSTHQSPPRSSSGHQLIINSTLQQLTSILFTHLQKQETDHQIHQHHHQNQFYFFVSSCCSSSTGHTINQVIAKRALGSKTQVISSSSTSDSIQILQSTKPEIILVSINVTTSCSDDELLERKEAAVAILSLLLTIQQKNQTKPIHVYSCLESPFDPSVAQVTLKVTSIIEGILKAVSMSSSASSSLQQTDDDNSPASSSFAELHEAVVATPTSKKIVGIEKFLDCGVTNTKESTVIQLEDDDDEMIQDQDARESLSSTEKLITQNHQDEQNKQSSGTWNISSEIEELCLWLLPLPSLPYLEVVDSDGKRKYSMMELKTIASMERDEEEKEKKQRREQQQKNSSGIFGDSNSSDIMMKHFDQIEQLVKNDLVELMKSTIQEAITKFETASTLKDVSQNNNNNNSNINSNNNVMKSKSTLKTQLQKVVEESVLDLIHVKLSKKLTSLLATSTVGDHYQHQNQNNSQQFVLKLKKLFDSLRSTSNGFLRENVIESEEIKKMIDDVVNKMIGQDILLKLTELIEDLQVVAAV